MCLCTKIIVNRSLHFDMYKQVRLSVPCGYCEECLRAKQNEWFCRLYYEWMSNRQNSNFFYTLTFNNENLPHWQNVPCFSKRLVQLFLKRLRKRLAKLDIKLKYFLVCEFGELKQRPHHHVNFFLSKQVNPYWFYKFVRDSWSYGFVQPGDNVGLIDSPKGIQYVTKYISKDFAHLDVLLPKLMPVVKNRYQNLCNYVIDRYFDKDDKICLSYDSNNIFHASFCSQLDSERVKEFSQKLLTKMRRIVRNLTCFHMQSSRLGCSIADFCVKELEKVPVMQTSGSVKMFKLPRYIKRLLWYDVVEGENSHKNDTFVLTGEGVRHSFEKLQFDVETEKLRIESQLLNISSNLNDFLPILNEQCKTSFSHWRDLVFWSQHFDLDLDVMALYKVVFRGRVCTFESELNSKFIKDNWLSYALACLFDCSDFDYGDISKNFALQRTLTNCMFNNHPYFQTYEQAVCILDCIGNLHRQFASDASVSKDKDVRKLRQYINFIV